MLLSDRDLVQALTTAAIMVDPCDHGPQIQPASIDVRLDRQFRVINNHAHTCIDPARQQDRLTTIVRADDSGFVLHPGEFALGSTIEQVTLGPRHAARLEGKSSLGRLGLLVHSTAGFIDPGFQGHITLELSNAATLPIILYPGMKIGQLCVMRLSSPAQRPYGTPGLGSRYQGQQGPIESRAWQDFTTGTVES